MAECWARTTAIAATTTIAAVIVTAAATVASVSATHLEDRLERLRETTGAPGMAAVTVSADGVEKRAAAGVRAQGRDEPVESGDPWHLGSNGKAMTAALAAVMIEKGLVDWDDSVTDHLGDLNVRIHSEWRFATLEHLLTHCSGLPPNVSRLKMLSLAGTDGERDATSDRRDYAEALLADPPLDDPGDRFRYSNAGYVVAGAMLEAAARQPFAELMQEHVFEPLRMRSAGFGPPGSTDALDAPRGHRAGMLGFGPVRPGAFADNPPAMTPAGRFHMTLPDYGRFLAEVVRGLDGHGRLLDHRAHRFLVEPGCSDEYAKGWGLRDGRLTHAGSNTMWFVLATVDPERGRAAAIASNDGRVDRQRAAFRAALDQLLGFDND